MRKIDDGAEKPRKTTANAASKKAVDDRDERVSDALFQCALNGNTTAIIFWLKNRRPDLWRDKPEAEKSDNGILPDLLEHWKEMRDKGREM